MGIFDNVGDTTGQLKAEGLSVNVTFQPGVPNPGQGTITWNIPGPVVESVDASGNITITAEPTGTNVVYGGIVLVLREGEPVDYTNIPKDGIIYIADPTADPQMFSGDRIGKDGLVVGAVYESEQKAQGLPLTTSLVINDIKDQTAYYVCGYIHDDQLRYYKEGNRAYSQSTSGVSGKGTPARQVVQLRYLPGVNAPAQSNGVNGPPIYGVKPTDGTGLVAGATYQFEIIYDPHFPHPDERQIVRMFFSFDGALAPTYGQLVKYLNEQISIKCTNAVQSPVPPAAGTYYWNATTQTLYYWNGSSLQVIEAVDASATAPTAPQLGEYWYNTLTNVLSQWNGSTWVPITSSNQTTAPANPTIGQYWYNPTTNTLSQWNGVAWVQVLTTASVIVQATDPAMPAVGSYWYDTTNGMLYQWNGFQYILVQPQFAFPTDPTQIEGNAYWWNGVNGFTRCGNTWCETTTYDQTTDPSCPIPAVPCAYWFDTTNTTLYNWNGTIWVQAYALMWPQAPNSLSNGTLWYNLQNDELFQRESQGPIATVGSIQPGAGYVNGTYTNVQLIGGHGIGALATIVVSNSIQTVNITNGGTLYNNNIDQQFFNVPLTGGTGSGAQATITVVSGTVITVQVTAGGSGYGPTDSLSVAAASIGGQNIGGVAFAAQVATVTGGVQAVTITTPGTNYIIGDALSVVGTSLGSTTGAGFVTKVLTLGPTATNAWIQQAVINSTVDPTTVPGDVVVAGTYWYNPTTEVLNQRDITNTIWQVVPVLVWSGDPTVVSSCELWWNESTNPATLFQWDFVHSSWDPVSAFYQQATDPYATPMLATGTLWWNPSNDTLLVWNGSSWSTVNFFNQPTDPTQPTVGTAWLDTTNNTWYIWGTPNPGWNAISPTVSATNPSMPPQGTFWFDTTNNVLYTRVGTQWVAVPYVTTPPVNIVGQTWYNLSTNQLMEWNGSAWVRSIPCIFCKLEHGQLIFETTGRGSNHVVLIPIPFGVPNQPSQCLVIGTGQVDYVNDSNSPYQNYPLGGFGNSYNCYCAFETPGSGRVRYSALPINPQGFLFSHLKPVGNLMLPQTGRDGVDGTPTYDQLGVGTNGSPAERRQLMSEVRTLLGYPTITVELDETELDLCVTNGLRVFRQKSSLAYDRKAFFLDIQPYKQNYILADKAVGYNKIVAVMAGYRFTSAFLSSALGAGVYGQVVLQHLYNMGTFDLLSYHIVSQYVENLEILFSTRLVFVFNEMNRELQIFQTFNRPERILLDVTIEKTEQEIFANRYAHRWVQQFALAEACDTLANIRGKYGNLPGASGSVTLNASDLKAQANDIRTRCQEEIDDYTVQNVEDFGAYGSIAIG